MTQLATVPDVEAKPHFGRFLRRHVDERGGVTVFERDHGVSEESVRRWGKAERSSGVRIRPPTQLKLARIFGYGSWEEFAAKADTTPMPLTNAEKIVEASRNALGLSDADVARVGPDLESDPILNRDSTIEGIDFAKPLIVHPDETETLNVYETTYKKVEQLARERGVSMGDIMEEALKELLRSTKGDVAGKIGDDEERVAANKEQTYSHKRKPESPKGKGER